MPQAAAVGIAFSFRIQKRHKPEAAIFRSEISTSADLWADELMLL